MFQVKETVGISAKDAADTANYHSQYAKEVGKDYAQAGQNQANAAKAKASGAYDSAAAAAGDATDYVKDSTAAG